MQGQAVFGEHCFEEENAKICECGMHFCQNPLDTLDYYPLIDDNGDLTEFAEVEALDDEVLTDDNKKYCTRKLRVGAKLSIAEFVRASVEVTKSQIEKEAPDKAGGDSATLAGGDFATLAGGYRATLAGGKYSILVGETESKAKGKKGSLIVLVERAWVEGEYIIKSFRAELIDGEKIKEDTFYKLENGELVEVKR